MRKREQEILVRVSTICKRLSYSSDRQLVIKKHSLISLKNTSSPFKSQLRSFISVAEQSWVKSNIHTYLQAAAHLKVKVQLSTLLTANISISF